MKKIITFSIKHKSLFQSLAPIFTIIATICYNFRKDEFDKPNDIPIGFGYEISIQFIWIIAVIIAIVSYGMFYSGQKNTADENVDLKNKIKTLEKSSEEILEIQLQLESEYESLRVNYNLFFDKILSLIYVDLDLGGRDRISVYFIPKDEEIFILQSRFSKNQNLRKKSNKNYPFEEGFIYKAIEESGLTENIINSPDNLTEYIKEVKGKCIISEDRISNLNMKSRSYYIKNIDDDTHQTIGLVVLESLDVNRFDNIDKSVGFQNHMIIVKEFLIKHRNRFISNLASNKGF